MKERYLLEATQSRNALFIILSMLQKMDFISNGQHMKQFHIGGLKLEELFDTSNAVSDRVLVDIHFSGCFVVAACIVQKTFHRFKKPGIILLVKRLEHADRFGIEQF